MPLDAIDYEEVVHWADERVISFVQTCAALHENPCYLRDAMVTDPVSGSTFPKLAAAAILERDGRTFYFVSEATRHEFEKQMSGHEVRAPDSRSGHGP